MCSGGCTILQLSSTRAQSARSLSRYEFDDLCFAVDSGSYSWTSSNNCAARHAPFATSLELLPLAATDEHSVASMTLCSMPAFTTLSKLWCLCMCLQACPHRVRKAVLQQVQRLFWPYKTKEVGAPAPQWCDKIIAEYEHPGFTVGTHGSQPTRKVFQWTTTMAVGMYRPMWSLKSSLQHAY
jgi:hypothetical protein